MQHFVQKLTFVAVLAAALPATTLLAQTTYNQRHSINERRGNEQERIHQGEASGQVTRREANHLEAHQHAIHNQERADRAADGGHLTAQDRHQLAREQNRQSGRVYRDKHDYATQPGVPPR